MKYDVYIQFTEQVGEDAWIRRTKHVRCDIVGIDEHMKSSDAQVVEIRAAPREEAPAQATNSAMDAIAWLEQCFKYVPDCVWRDDLRRFIEAQRHQ